MTEKKDRKAKDKSYKKTVKAEAVSFSELLGGLLPKGNEWAVTAMQRATKRFEEVLGKEADAADGLLAIEKQKTECLEEVLGIVVDQFQRVSADYANFQKRSPKQVSEAIAYEKEKIVKSLLPAIDNFEHTLSHTENAESAEDVFKGVKIIYDQMLDILKSHEAEQIEALGEQFDPALHQAMMQRAEGDKEDGVVLEVFQTGYMLNGRVIRPAKVIVNKLATEQSPDESEEEQDQSISQ